MKKIAIKLSHQELTCFIAICKRFANENPDRLIKVLLLELALKLEPRTYFHYAKPRTIQLPVAHGMAFNRAVGSVSLDSFDPYSLAVVTSFYQTTNKYL